MEYTVNQLIEAGVLETGDEDENGVIYTPNDDWHVEWDWGHTLYYVTVTGKAVELCVEGKYDVPVFLNQKLTTKLSFKLYRRTELNSDWVSLTC